MSHFVVPPKTVIDQRRAADPSASAWVSANAGSGKTKVLADRVLRLLLDEVEPTRILCLTFTKAAAANMSNRVFDELGTWVVMDDATLAARLEALDGVAPSAQRIAVARRLFARAVETPGGLKIETIHAFCERLLHLFPFEANVPARFEVLDEALLRKLLEQATQEVLAVAGESAVGQALDIVAREAGDEAVGRALRSALRYKLFLREHADPESLERVLGAFARQCGIAPGDTPDSLRRSVIEDGIAPAEWAAIAELLDAGAKTDKGRAALLRQALAARDETERFVLYRDVFFTKAGTPSKSMGTKAIDPVLIERLVDEQGRIDALLGGIRAAEAIARTRSLFVLAQAVFARLEALKSARAALDFDDLIARTVNLLTKADAAWILYKLDAGIDHVLVDEAQDTSPDQWAILRKLVEEFTSGEGVSPRRRTLFAVGDPKQSIYGFQGAAPHEFEANGRYFLSRSKAAGMAFEDVQLTVSFRSAPEVLSAVDAVFALPHHAKGLTPGDAGATPVHESARPSFPGVVDVWPTIWKDKTPEADAWSLPLDEPDASEPAVRLARKVAHTIRRWMHEGDETGRRMPPGDVLVLVRKRHTFFEAVIRALKDAGVPVAGADRLTVADHIAVRDLVAAGRVALLARDDLTLAAALKSPLAGWGDDDLIRIAAPRADDTPLIDAIRTATDGGDPAALRAIEHIETWQAMARTHGPFGFYAMLLGPQAGRRKLVARLGAEAGDAIDSFLSQALAYERRFAPSLAGFLSAFENATGDIKRDMDDTRDEVRVMTVHGAKGLEAPVVILADGGEKPDGSHDPDLIEVPVGIGAGIVLTPIWSPGQRFDPVPVAEARAALRAKAVEENARLLYVALTRARDRLIVASAIKREPKADDAEAGAAARPPDESWSGMVVNGLEAAPEDAARYGHLTRISEEGGGEILRWSSPDKTVEVRELAKTAPQPDMPVPDWLAAPVHPEMPPAPPLRPSSALDAADRPHRPLDDASAAETARLRGQFVHALIERLPALAADRRRQAAIAYLDARAPRLAVEERSAIADAALSVVNAPALAALFGPSGRGEVAIAGDVTLTNGQTVPVSGRIDRLAILGDEVHIADFKTGAPPTVQHDTHLAQLALYRELLTRVMPEKSVRAFLVYAQGPAVVEISAERLDTAIRKVVAGFSRM
ncbi:double-strand break repair helicase AddA [Pseudochelatococcus contaminans]|uniref:DNA 3'-5' helicase n=1 Tax=Pseudochelatococcus contaminans TaxID=1538103 RepID=A0A7W5Z4F8_9HYPH|nr:double-strand break repair helicase AddA [Pseudochelatococcus contaminans]MBB3809670.1 ATP-dependent helicase/nuclease subunit A [Pseudochelatococcus contaminans]